MSDEYLKTARKNGLKADSSTSEADLIQNHEGMGGAYEALSAIRKTMVEEKVKALDGIDEKYREDLKEAEAQYAMLLSLSR